DFLELKVRIHRELLDRINLSALDKMSRERIGVELEPIVQDIVAKDGEAINRAERARLLEEVLDELLGLGPLEPLLQDETINDILVNGFDTVFVERAGRLVRV